MLNSSKIILDCDPGNDDAIAIVVLLNACKDRVKMLLSTYGNISLDMATKNSLTLTALLGADIPVLRGSEKPGPGNVVYEDASYIHGGDGLGGLQSTEFVVGLPEKEAVTGDFLQILYEAIMEEESVDFITLGPLTNLSELIKRYPDVLTRIDQVVTMGGGVNLGNVTPYAEFNLYCDAESAAHVFSVVPHLTLAPIDITTQVAFDLPRIAEIGKAGTKVAGAMEVVLTANYNTCVAYGEPGATMHDSAAILAYLHPELFEFRSCGINVDCEKEHYGESIPTDSQSNIRLITATQPERLLDLIAQSITEYVL